MEEWLSTQQVARLLGVSVSTVYRSLLDPAAADVEWGAGNWRTKPLARRTIFQVRGSAVARKAGNQPNAAG